ncbi:MAG: hypothetical protein HY240_07085 [Actinobacteria bacterium]|nr:hypothetical protein [Actinomycetota bacterium]
MTDELDLVRSLGESVEPDDVIRDRVYAAIQTRLDRSPRRFLVLAGLAAAALAITVVVALALDRSSVRTPTQSAATPSFPPGWSLKPPEGVSGGWLPTPFLHAHDLSLPQAQAMVGFEIPRPADPLASDDQIQDVWVAQLPDEGGGTETQIRVVYSTGVYVELEPAIPELIGDPAAQLAGFRQMAAEDASATGGQARVTTVNGAPAYFIPQGAATFANGQSQGNAGWVFFLLGDQGVDVVGYMSDADLLRVASSIAPRPA